MVVWDNSTISSDACPYFLYHLSFEAAAAEVGLFTKTNLEAKAFAVGLLVDSQWIAYMVDRGKQSYPPRLDDACICRSESQYPYFRSYHGYIAAAASSLRRMK